MSNFRAYVLWHFKVVLFFLAISFVSDFKDNCDHALAAKAIPEAANAECLGWFIYLYNTGYVM